MSARVQRRKSAARPHQQSALSRIKMYSMVALTLAIFVSGIFFAARNHFLSWDYGMKNSKLRKQIDDLETEKRRLLLARETSSSSSEVRRVARKMGLADSPSATASAASSAASVAVTAVPASATADAAPAGASRVVKTADTKPSYSVVAASLKTTSPAKSKSDREGRRESAE